MQKKGEKSKTAAPYARKTTTPWGENSPVSREFFSTLIKQLQKWGKRRDRSVSTSHLREKLSVSFTMSSSQSVWMFIVIIWSPES